MSNTEHSGRYALVTGASRGLGRAAAVALAREGAHVIALARTVGGLEELDDEIFAATGEHATLIPCDLLKNEAVDNLGPALFERFGRLDALVLNAGQLGELAPLPDIAPKVWDRTIAVNLTANWRILRTLHPLLLASDAGRVTFITSGAARRTRAYWGVYSVSKAALDALAGTYANECRNTTIRVSLVDPGRMRTRMRSQAMPGEDPETQPLPEIAAPLIVRAMAPSFQDNGARLSVDEASDD